MPTPEDRTVSITLVGLLPESRLAVEAFQRHQDAGGGGVLILFGTARRRPAPEAIFRSDRWAEKLEGLD